MSQNIRNNGQRNSLDFVANGRIMELKLNAGSSMRMTRSISTRLGGPLFIGGVQAWTPEVLDDLSSDTHFLGCLEVCIGLTLSMP